MSRRSEEQDQARSRGRPKGLPKRWSAQPEGRGGVVVTPQIAHRPMDAPSSHLRPLVQHGQERPSGFAELAEGEDWLRSDAMIQRPYGHPPLQGDRHRLESGIGSAESVVGIAGIRNAGMIRAEIEPKGVVGHRAFG